jgi:hypothetical protein
MPVFPSIRSGNRVIFHSMMTGLIRFQLVLVLCELAAALSVDRARDTVLFQCARCSGDGVSWLKEHSIEVGTEAVYAGAFELAWEGLALVRGPYSLSSPEAHTHIALRGF